MFQTNINIQESRFKLIVASLFTQLVSGFYDHMSHEILDPIPSYHIVLLITSYLTILTQKQWYNPPTNNQPYSILLVTSHSLKMVIEQGLVSY